MMDASILMVDDDRDVLESARMFLKQEFRRVVIEDDPEKITAHLRHEAFDVLVLDMNFRKGVNDGEAGFYWLQQILLADPDAVVVLITAYGEIDLAVKAMKSGAVDFILKPWKNQQLLATLMAALQLRKTKQEVERLKVTQSRLVDDINSAFNDFVGQSPAILRVREVIERVAGTTADVLILGENGTGKELVARAIHRQSPRAKNPFIRVDMGALADTLFESELFGQVKGAFTDARTDRAGRFEIASGGTLFLDEIGNIPYPLQSKLLTALQQRKIQRLGSAVERPVDIRLISATNMPLHEMIAEKKFRQDLLYRINTVEIRVPALRERREDIPLLIEHFLTVYGKKYHRPGIRMEKSVVKKLMEYAWPGNIRELQHAMERAVILSEETTIRSADGVVVSPAPAAHPPDKPLTLEEMEKQFILKSLHDHDGNVSRTAKTLGMTRTALYRRINKHRLPFRPQDDEPS